MAERRKPDTVLWVRHEKGRSIKVEVFHSAHFERLQLFTDRAGKAIPLNNRDHYYRIRVDGVWFPAGRRVLYTKNQCLSLIKREIFQ